MEDRINNVESDVTIIRTEFEVKFGATNKEIEVLKNEKVKLGHELHKLEKQHSVHLW